MQFLIVGDLQAKKENLHLVRILLDQVEAQNYDVIWLGDLLDRRGHIEAEVLNTLYDYFSTSKHEHWIIVGNHDLLAVHSQETALQPLKALSNIIIVDEPTYLVGDGPACNSSILMVPYYRNPQKFLAAINDKTLSPKPTTLICHQGIKEFTIGSGYTEDGAVFMADVAQFHLVIAGHYHTPQQCGNVVYVGSPFSHSFGESNENKRLAIFNTETLGLEYLPTKFPRHITLDITLTDEFDSNYLMYDHNDYVRVIVSGTDEQIKKFQNNPIASTPVKFIYKPIGSGSILITENLSNTDKWLKWAKDIKKLDEETIRVGLELLK